MALLTLPKIISFLSPGQKFVVIDDGTFDKEIENAIAAISPQIQIITRPEREDFVQDAIRHLHNCIKYRSELPLAFKLIDIPLLAQKESPRFTFTDSDIIYIKNCQPYFNQQRDVYLKTDAIKLSVKLRDGLLKYKWKMPLRFNSGYFSFKTDNYDLDFINYYLGLPDVRNSPWLSEQTCWALLFGKLKESYCPRENEFACNERFQGPQDDTVAIHLIGNLKRKVAEWSAFVPKADPRSPGFDKSRNINIADWTIKSVRRMAKI